MSNRTYTLPTPASQSRRNVMRATTGEHFARHIGTVRLIGFEKIDESIATTRGNIRPVWVAQTIGGTDIAGQYRSADEAAEVFA